MKTKRGKDTEKSMCERFFQCETCKKVIEREKRKPEHHRAANGNVKIVMYISLEITYVINARISTIVLKQNREDIFSLTSKLLRTNSSLVRISMYRKILATTKYVTQRMMSLDAVNVEYVKIVVNLGAD